MSLPSPAEIVARSKAARFYEMWLEHTAGTPQTLHSQTPDKISFQAGYLMALIELELNKKETYE